ncbi:MAG: hypothetical protein RRB13_05840 [bacterium]|nr:hypothetical protein [bacterium]
MRVENQALKRLLAVSPLAEAYAKEAFINMGEQLDEKLADYLHKTVVSYSKLTTIKDRIFGARDIGDKLEVALDLMPTLIFTAPFRFKAEGRPAVALRQLHIAVLDAAMNRYRESTNFQTEFFKSIPFSIKQAELDQKMDLDKGDETFLPRQVMLEMIQVAQGFLRLPKSGKRNELIEQYYIYQATTQIFFQFYFELITKAPSDMVVALIEKIFAYLLAALRRFEILHFMQSDVSSDQIEFWIEKDAANARHPMLRKHIFSYAANYSPLLRAGGQQALSANGQRLLQIQIEAIKQMGVARLTLLLKSLRRYRGKGPIKFILAQLQRSQMDLLESLLEHLQNTEDAEEQDILRMAAALGKNLRGKSAQKQNSGATGKVLASAEAQRLVSAKRNLANMDTSKMLNQHKIADYLKEQLKKVYERARKEGAMTKDKIPKYLASFADSSSTVLSKPRMAPSEVEEFVASTDQILEEIVSSAGLTEAELQDTRESITTQSKALLTAETVEEKAEILNSIGDKLMDAQNQAEEKLPEAERQQVKFEKLKDSKIISIGFEEFSPSITVAELMSFPLGTKEAANEEEWFKCHLSYLHILADHSKIDKEKLDNIEAVKDRFPKIRYKKYFDIFPNNKFDDSVLSAVYSLWENNGLERLRLDQSA